MGKTYKSYDIAVIGTGAAGLYAALQFDDSVSVLLVSKKDILLSNSMLAQGGVAAVLDPSNDDYLLHMQDSLIAGSYTNDVKSLEMLVKEGPDDVLRLKKMGVDFDLEDDGSLAMTLEGGHSRRRIVHHKDSTGREIVVTLSALLHEHPNIEPRENTMLYRITETKGGFYIGLMTLDGTPDPVFARYVILATGGIGRLFQHTTNSAICTGDGIAIAYDLGSRIKNMHLIQFHPTAFASSPERECFLISEAVRGEGAKLRNFEMQTFMTRYDLRGELAPRDVVSRSILQESARTGSKTFYLDITHKSREFLMERFPMIYEHCLSCGYDIAKVPIPIYPCQHYLMGGIDVDLNGLTSVNRLYAAGECSHTGVHGSNRLASNSLLEAVVFGRRAALDVQKRLKTELVMEPDPRENLTAAEQSLDNSAFQAVLSGTDSEKILPGGTRREIRRIMQETMFVTPNRDILENSLRKMKKIRHDLKNGGYRVTPAYIETYCLATVARLVLEHAKYAAQ